MPRIHYLPDEKEVEADPVETILQVSLRAEIPHTHVCGGHARCSTCRVLIVEGIEHCAPRNSKEQLMAERLAFGPIIRLACQTTLTGNVKLRRLVLDDEDTALVDQSKPGATVSSVGDEKRIAILFADIRGFTPFAELLPPYDVIHVLNRYFQQMSHVIDRFGGYIDNYMGDGLMALFGVENPDGAALRAVRAGLEMLEALERLKPYLQTVYGRSFEIGIGVHYGEVVVGTVGAMNRQRVTAIGDAVNLASRIEAANKLAGTKFLISEQTYKQVTGRAHVNQALRLSLPGKSGQYTLFEVVGIE